jgi:hypothetical protein
MMHLSRVVLMLSAGMLPALATVFAIGVMAGERAGYTPLSNGGPANAAEAAALGNASDVLRYLWQGERFDHVQPLRPSIISSQVLRATPLEAAIWSRQLELMRLLDAHNAIAGDATRHHLACLAQDIKLVDVAGYLAPDGVGACGPDEGFARVLARSAAVEGR